MFCAAATATHASITDATPPSTNTTDPPLKLQSNNTLLPLTPHPTFFGDVDPALADVSAATLRPHSYATFFNPVGPNPAWKFVPCTYLVCEDDAATPVEAQDSMIEYVRANGCQLDSVERIKASHSPFLSQPEWTAAAIRRACGEDVAE